MLSWFLSRIQLDLFELVWMQWQTSFWFAVQLVCVVCGDLVSQVPVLHKSPFEVSGGVWGPLWANISSYVAPGVCGVCLHASLCAVPFDFVVCVIAWRCVFLCALYWATERTCCTPSIDRALNFVPKQTFSLNSLIFPFKCFIKQQKDSLHKKNLSSFSNRIQDNFVTVLYTTNIT